VEDLSAAASRHAARLIGRRRLSGRVLEIELEKPAEFSFTAGQHVRIFAGGQGRDYSIASGPGAGTLSFCVRIMDGGAVSPLLAETPVGASLAFTGPHGVFAFRDSARPAVWAATGVGIAPFLSMMRAGARGFTLLHGVRRSEELYGRSELEAAAGCYVACVTAESAPGCFSGRVTAWAAENLLPGVYDFSLCGNRHMVRDFVFLVDDRFAGSRVFTEIFF
jgi:benzoate/toluate 1,2-dioxygenase reductase subunit